MTEILLVCVGVVAIFAAGFFGLKFMEEPPERKWTLFSAAMLFTAALVPAVVTLLSPRTGSSGAFTEFTAGPQSATVTLIIRGVGYFFIVAVPLLVLFRKGFTVPAAALALTAYAVVGWISALVNGQAPSIDLFYAALAVVGVMGASRLSLDDALRLSRRALRVFVWASLALALAAPTLVFWDGQGRTWFGVSQLAGVTAHPNGMGTVASLAIMVELIRVEGMKRPTHWHLLAPVVALLATQSRGAWLSAAIGIALYLAFRSGAQLFAILTPIVMAVGLAASTLVEGIAEALAEWSSGGDITTLNGRTVIWESALDAVARNPLFGTGPRSFELEYRGDILGLGNLISSSNAHNQIVQTLVERGVLGLLILAVLVVILFRNALRLGGSARAGLLGVLAVFVSRFIVETPLYVSTASLNGALLVIVTVLIASAQNEPPMLPTVKPAARGTKLPDAYNKPGFRQYTTTDPRILPLPESTWINQPRESVEMRSP
jgi:O-antigen ligase